MERKIAGMLGSFTTWDVIAIVGLVIVAFLKHRQRPQKLSILKSGSKNVPVVFQRHASAAIRRRFKGSNEMLDQEFLPEMRGFHSHCFGNRTEIEASEMCGCFHCLEVFPPSEIREWIPDKVGPTARFPRCGLDNVIGNASGLSLSEEFLGQMEKY